MSSTITPSQRRKAYRLKRIVISEHNYLALKRLGQAGDSFNDVINNLLRIERNHQQDKEEKEKKQERLQRQERSRDDEDNNSISNAIGELYPPGFIEDFMEKHDRELEELARLYKEERKQEQKEQQLSNSNRA
jgi:predicted CopG family antitoxin